jgi:hypothetical protein
MAAISASVQPTSASRVTAVPRKSWNVTPTIPAAACAIRQDWRKPPPVHGLRVAVTKISGLTFAVASSAAFSAAPPGSPEDLREKQNEKAAQNGFDKSGNPVAPWSQNKSFFLDFLLQ